MGQATSSMAAVAALALFAGEALAQEAGTPAAAPTDKAAQLSVELNQLAPSQKGCLMTFVAENKLGAPVGKLSLELAFFNDKNAVDKLTVVDFRDLPEGRKRVRQFDLPGVKCETVSRIIVNDAPVCQGPEAGACMKGLVTRSQIATPFEG